MAQVSTPRRSLDPSPGAVIGGRYEIDRLLARGGVGVVYVAHERDSGREVVIKFLAGHLAGESEASARFDREVERLSGIQHPNIVELLDHGQENGAPFLVMEYLSGEPLLAYLTRKGQLSLAEFVPIAAQILKALGYAHARGLMHRDIKPGNIMLTTRKGRANFVKLLDFGMAKLVEGERDITTEQVVGTANYMAPEQVRGEPLDARVDVYACGLLFYRMLAGVPPFTADNNSALLYKQVHELPPPLASKMPAGHEVPDELLALIDRCIAKDPRERPDDANDLTEALVDCVPAQLFRLPLAEGADSNATGSALLVLPEARTEPSSASMKPGGEAREASSGSMAAPDRRRRRRGGAPSTRSRPVLAGAEIDIDADAPAAPAAPPVVVPLPSEGGGGLRWIILAVVLVAGGVAAALLAGGSEPATERPENSLEVKRAAARLDQVEAMILSGEFAKAREELAALRPLLDRVPNGVSRAGALERRIAVLIALEVARKFEAAGDRGAAEKAYHDVLAIDAGNADARSALERLKPPQKTAEPPPEDDPRPRPRPRDRGDKKGKTSGGSKELDPGPVKKEDSDSIFLPTNK